MAAAPDNLDPRTAALLHLYAPTIRTLETGSKGGDYGNIGPLSKKGDRPYGAYQVMGTNVGPWTQKYYGRALTPDEFLKTPEAQDAVFNGEFGRLTDKYGPHGAAVAWHGGEGGLANPNKADVLGKTNAAYGSDFLRALGIPQQQPAAAAGAPQQPVPSLPGAGPAPTLQANAGGAPDTAPKLNMALIASLLDGFTPKPLPQDPYKQAAGLLGAVGGFKAS
jgi:hypothetical protein